MRSVVIGTAGHIDHGKTTLLRALTGIDADRLPEERARGMTIDVGFAHLDVDDGSSLDFVDVPGHDRLVGNMLVGAGEIDAVLLVVAADDGPRAQTIEHLELVDAIGHDLGVVAITKADAVDAPRLEEVRAAVRELIDRTSLRGAPIVAVSGATGLGLEELRPRLREVRDAVLDRDGRRPHGPVRLAIDRAFSINGRGTVVTGTLRGGSLTPGALLRVEPGGGSVRVREVQVRHGRSDQADGGRTGLNVVVDAPRARGGDRDGFQRGQVATAGPGVQASRSWLATIEAPTVLTGAGSGSRSPSPPRSSRREWPPKPGTSVRLHLGTQQADATVRPVGARWPIVDSEPLPGDGMLPAAIRLHEPLAALAGECGVLRDAAASRVVARVRMLDPKLLRGPSRRRATRERLAAVVEAGSGAAFESAVLELHGVLRAEDGDAIRAAFDMPPRPERGLLLPPDVESALRASAEGRVLGTDGIAIGELRTELAVELRRLVTIDRSIRDAASRALDTLIHGLVTAGRIARQGDRLVDPARRADTDAALEAAMARLDAALDVDVPPGLAEAALAAGCPPPGLRALEAAGRIVRVDDDLAWSRGRYEDLRDRAVRMASAGPLTPAAFRDAIGGNRRVVMALLEDLDRKGVLRRTDAGRVPGPRVTVRA